MKNLKLWSGLVTIFLLGVIVGVVTSNIVVRRHFEGFMRGGPQTAHHRIVMETIRGIDISPAQQQKIDSILVSVRPEMEELSSGFFHRMKENTEHQMEEVRALLDEGQKIKFDRNRKKLEERMKKYRSRRNSRRSHPETGKPPLPRDDG